MRTLSLTVSGGSMKYATLLTIALATATPAAAQHVHDHGPAAPQQGGAPAAPPQAGAPAAPQRGGGPQTPPIDVPWNDALPAGTADHAARALKESSRHGEWVDIKLADGTALKS